MQLFSASVFCLQAEGLPLLLPSPCQQEWDRDQEQKRIGSWGDSHSFCMDNTEWEDGNVKGKTGVATYALLRNLDFSIESYGKTLWNFK